MTPAPHTAHVFAAPLLRRGLCWSITLAGVMAALAATVDAEELWRAGAPARVVLAGALAAAGVAAWMGALAAWPWATVASLALPAGRHAPWRLGVPIFAAALAAALWLSLATPTRRPGLHLMFELGFAGGVTACAWVARSRAPRWTLPAALVSGVLCVIELWPPRALYPGLHDLIGALAIAAAFAAVTPLRTRLAAAGVRVLAGAALAMVGAASLAIAGAGAIAPGWRAAAEQHASWSPRLARQARALVDLDRDGYSPIAWGGDCDDLDAHRHPLAAEDAGGEDRNCNGVDVAAPADDAARGLAPARGTPELPAGAIDLVVLVTVDTWRADTLDQRWMPRLSEHARRAVVLERSYSCGTRTEDVVPKLLRTPAGNALSDVLRAAGVRSIATVALPGGTWARFLRDFDLGQQVRDDAAAVTDAALLQLASCQGRRCFLWLHYLDPHQGYRRHAGAPADLPPGLRGAYLGEVAHVDAELSRFLDGLAAQADLQRTVVVITGDHGEALGEHGVATHTVGAWESIVRVPVLIFAPGLTPGVRPQLSSCFDVAPTILGSFGLPAGEDAGRSWLRLRDAPDAPLHEFVVVLSHRLASGAEPHAPIVALVEGQWKLVHGLADGVDELYDLTADPDEAHDLATAPGGDAARLRRLAAAWLDLHQQR